MHNKCTTGAQKILYPQYKSSMPQENTNTNSTSRELTMKIYCRQNSETKTESIKRLQAFSGFLIIHTTALLIAFFGVYFVAGCEETPFKYTENRDPCSDHNPLKNVYFGDLHVHTGLSWDAWGYDNFHTPWDAYRFAKGEPIKLPPLDENNEGTRVVQMDRPLDFVLVSDHLEFLGEVLLCTEPGHAAYDTTECAMLRERNTTAVTVFGMQTAFPYPERFEMCPPEEADCIMAGLDLRWFDIQQAAEDYYDRSSSCEFVTFVGYEYTATPDTTNMHRNVIFANERVPERPPSYFEENTPYGLWRNLEESCLKQTKGCDVMTIAHNSNLSNGRMFTPDYDGAETIEEKKEAAALRLKMEPLAEIFQHKGDMECRNGLSGIGGEADPFCNFEKLRGEDAEDCGDETGRGGMRLGGCVSRLDFLRNVLKRGLKEEAELAINPFKLGILASTDTHNSISGYVDENSYMGHIGTVDDSPEKRMGKKTLTHDTYINNPGGLTAVWAEEKSRSSIFSAMKRREVYGTSGPRIVLRFFGGWSYSANLCENSSWLETAYETGVPMGSDLPLLPEASEAPTFVIRAEADRGTDNNPGVPLQQIHIIKGWLTKENTVHEKVYTVAGDPENGATVDPETCTPQGEGFDTLCATWTDPDFDSTQPAFYYVRVIENPVCRWTTWECLRMDPETRPESCDYPEIPKIIQERAWSSPIWYTPNKTEEES